MFINKLFLDILKLSYGDFIVHQLIYKDLSWEEAKTSCKKLSGVLPYFDTGEDLKGLFIIFGVINFYKLHSAIKSSLLATIYKRELNLYGTYVWLGYQRQPKNDGEMINVYTRQKSKILPYQRDIGQNCGAYNPYYKSYSFFDFYCGAFQLRRKLDHYWTICLVPDDV